MYNIYYYQNKLNDKIYIGQTDNWTRRHRQHLHDSKLLIEYAIVKYGINNFTFSILESWETCEEANEAEEFWIQYLNSLAPNGYNIALGGKNAPKSQEHRRKISEALKGHPVSYELREKMAAACRGKKISEANKKKMSWKGKKHSPETKIKMSKSAKGRISLQKGMTWKLIDGKRVWINK